MKLDTLTSSHSDACLDFVAGAPLIYHCHHFNLFLDQTVDDALGHEAGAQLRVRVATDAWRQLLTGVTEGLDLRTPAERLGAAQDLFAAMGHGHMNISADPKGGAAEGEHLHYGTAWRQKYGHVVRRHSPADCVATGFAAAATQVAFKSEAPLSARETACITTDAPLCSFEISPGGPAPSRVVQESDVGACPITEGVEAERIQQINLGLRDFLSGVSGDDRGLVEAFGVFVTRHMTNYYNGISYGVVDAVRERNEALVPVVEALLRESGHVCVFNTFGGIMYSPEWDALVGRVEGDLTEVVSSCVAIARALGFGRWNIEALSADELILSTHAEYESPWCSATREVSCEANSYFLQGAAIAFMRLATALDWKDRKPLTQDLYNELFRSGLNWSVEQTHCLAHGDATSRVIVRRK